MRTPAWLKVYYISQKKANGNRVATDAKVYIQHALSHGGKSEPLDQRIH